MVTTNFETVDTVGGTLPELLGGASTGSPKLSNPHADVYIDGLGLNLHITPNSQAYAGNPYTRQTADAVKPQYDTQPSAGEHSLSSWWLRSQMSFHCGAGIKYLDTNSQDIQASDSTAVFRYDTSRGIDVWTKGELKRLPDTTLLASTTGRTWLFSTTLTSGESYLIYAYQGTIKAQLQNAGTTITYSVTGMTGQIKDIVIDGTHYIVATTDGKIFQGPIDNSAAGAVIWNLPSSVSDVTLGWVKQRLIAGIDNGVYELATGGPTLPTAVYLHPNANWRWSAWSEGPNAVIGGGAAGTSSAIYSFTIGTGSGTVPVLQPGFPIATMPVGEIVKCLYFYTGNMLVIGSSVGLRVGVFQSFYGTFSYGPLTFPSRLEDAQPVTSISGRGSYVYAGTSIDSEASLIRVDLGTQTDQGIYAWAPDLRPAPAGVSGQVTGVTVDASLRLRFSVQNYGVVGEVPGSFTGRDAWLRTGRIRYGTVEPKHFKYAQVRAEGVGTFLVTATSDAFPSSQIYSAPSNGQSQRFGVLTQPCEWVQLTFNVTGAGKITSYQLLGLPAGTRSKLISLPVQIFDHEQNRNHQRIGFAGRAKALLDTLEELETNGDEITLQCPVLGIDAIRCTVEKFTFTQTSNPAPNKRLDVGGFGVLTFRTSS